MLPPPSSNTLDIGHDVGHDVGHDEIATCGAAHDRVCGRRVGNMRTENGLSLSEYRLWSTTFCTPFFPLRIEVQPGLRTAASLDIL